jgi:hypothetical protein
MLRAFDWDCFASIASFENGSLGVLSAEWSAQSFLASPGILHALKGTAVFKSLSTHLSSYIFHWITFTFLVHEWVFLYFPKWLVVVFMKAVYCRLFVPIF